MTIHNATPHAVNIVDAENKVIKVFPKEDFLIRLSVQTQPSAPINGVPTSKTVFGDAQGLPDFEEGKYYIVSQLIKSALPERLDLLVPAEVVRSNEGKILGCRSLGR
jgi:hypothetical protein